MHKNHLGEFKKNLFEGQGFSLADIKQQLHSMSYAEDTMGYLKPFSTEEMHFHSANLSQIAIKRRTLENELKTISDEFKNKIKMLSGQFNETLTGISNKGVQVEGKVFLLDDQENKLMHYYDEEGNHISSRPLLPSERQLNIVSESYRMAANDTL